MILVCGVASATLLGACDGGEVRADVTDQAKTLGEDALDKAADASKALAGEVADRSVDGSKQVLEAGKAKAGELWADVPDSGELSDTVTEWLSSHATEDSMSALVVRGKQVAPVALEMGRVLGGAVQSDTKIEPIYQPLDERGEAFDAAIEDMPRVEVIDGVQVGFRQLDALSASRSVKERGYLVTWRRNDHLVGFVYRSTRTIDLDTLVAETPRLLALTQSVLD